MSTDIVDIKRKLLIKYPTFGSTIANLEFQANSSIVSAGTNGKIIFYNPKFLDNLSEKQQVSVFAHQVCHVAFEHILRCKGKDKRLWDIATDSVINALLKQDGLPIIEGGVDIPEAIDYDAEEMYNKLLKEKKNKEQQGSHMKSEQQSSQDQQPSQGESEQQGSQKQQGSREESGQKNSQGQQNSQVKSGQQSNQGQQNSQSQQDDIVDNTHSLWEEVLEDIEAEREVQEENSKFVEQGERETFKQNKIERSRQLQELSERLASESAQEAGYGLQREKKKLSDIGTATSLIDWRRLLRQSIKYDEEYTRKYARMRNGYFRYRVEQIPMSESEILLDTSGSVSEILLKNFLRECKNILDNSKVKVGCFNAEFHGFTELKRPEDIDNMWFPIGGGTNFNVAVDAFSTRAQNKIIFTDGRAPMPNRTVKGVIWIVFGNAEIEPKGGKVINITGKQLKRLCQPFSRDKDDRSR